MQITKPQLRASAPLSTPHSTRTAGRALFRNYHGGVPTVKFQSTFQSIPKRACYFQKILGTLQCYV